MPCSVLAFYQESFAISKNDIKEDIIVEWQHNTPAFVTDVQGDLWMGINFDNLIIFSSIVMPKHLHFEIFILS